MFEDILLDLADELGYDDYSGYDGYYDPDTADADRYPSTEDGEVFDKLY